MNLALKKTLEIFTISIIILAISHIVFYKLNYDIIIDNSLKECKASVDKISSNMNQHLIEKVTTIKTIGATPSILNALKKSNSSYELLSKEKRNEDIVFKNKKWKITKNQNDPFILEFTDNKTAQYLKNLQQTIIKGEFGEIFLTNKYGAVVASTTKLTTFSHKNKYWWQGAYNNGKGLVFLDDRGYDESAGGYVLGIVIPIKEDNEIIGILKANLNILGAINQIITSSQDKDHENLKLLRSNGLIVFEENTEPLKVNISNKLQKKISTQPQKSFIFKENSNEFIVSFSEIKISSNLKGFKFGGNFKTIDHKKGNTGETWFILDMYPIKNVIKPVKNVIMQLWILGLLLSIVFAITSLIIGKRMASPLRLIIKQTKKIIDGNYNVKIRTTRSDEIGNLAKYFNLMTTYLLKSTTSIDKLNIANNKLKINEKILKKREEEYKEMIEKSGDAIIIRQKNQIIFVNEAFVKMLDYSKEDLLQIENDKLFSKKISNKNKNRDNKFTDALYESTLYKQDGTKIFVEFSERNISFKNQICQFIIIRDITKQKEIMTLLQKETEQTKGLKNFIPICAGCNLIRDDESENHPWVKPADYITKRLPNIKFSHSMCPDCIKKWALENDIDINKLDLD